MIGKSNINVSGDFTGEELEDIIRNLKTLYETPERSIPLDRGFGLNLDMIDDNIEAAKNEYAVEVITKTENYESRVAVDYITFEVNEGTLIPTINLVKGDD